MIKNGLETLKNKIGLFMWISNKKKIRKPIL